MSINSNSAKIVSIINQRANEKMNSINSDSYFTSDKVLFPALNGTVEWDHTAKVFGLDLSRYVVTRSKKQIDNEILSIVNDAFLKEPPLKWLKSEIQDLTLSDSNAVKDIPLKSFESDALQQIEKIQNDLRTINRNIFQQVLKIERLVTLERNTAPLLYKGERAYEQQIHLYNHNL